MELLCYRSLPLLLELLSRSCLLDLLLGIKLLFFLFLLLLGLKYGGLNLFLFNLLLLVRLALLLIPDSVLL